MDPYRNFNTYKIDPISEIRNAGIVTNGSVYWVSSTSDSEHTTRTNVLGNGAVKTSVQDAINASVNDRDDYIMVIPTNGGTVFPVGTAIDLNKDRVHLIGVGYTRARRGYSTTFRDNMGTTPDTEVLNVTGDGCEIAGLRFLGTLGTNAGGTMSNGIAFIQGLGLHVHDSVFESSMDVWGTPPVVRGAGTAAHDARFDECSFAITGTGNVESAGNAALVMSGNGNKRWTFNDCTFTLPAGSVTETFFTPGTGAIERVTLNRCYFGGVNGTQFVITSAVRGSVTANNPVLLNHCTTLAVTVLGTDTSVFAVPTQSGTAGAGIHNPLRYTVGTGIAPIA